MADKIDLSLSELYNQPDDKLAQIIRNAIQSYADIMSQNNYEGTFLVSAILNDAAITIAIVTDK